MSRKVSADKDEVIADWRTGGYTVRSLGDKHGISHGTVYSWTKGITKDFAPLIDKIVETKQSLAKKSEQEVSIINSVVDEKTKDLAFIRESSLLVVNEAVNKVKTEDCTMRDLRDAQDVIGKGKDNIYDKTAPITAVQVNIDNNPLDPVLQDMINMS